MPTRDAVRSAFAFAFALVSLAGCGPGPEAGDGPIVLSAADLQVRGTSDAIAVVRDLAPMPDGTVWVQSSGDPFFIALGPDGDVVATHGRQGGGPEEFGSPAGFVSGGTGDGVWVFDQARHALIRVSTPDARAEVALPRESVPPGTVLSGLGLTGRTIRMARLGDEIVLPRRSSTGELAATEYWTAMWNADLVALNPETGSVRTVLSLDEAMGDLGAHFQSVSPGFPPFPFWHRLWAVCGDEVRLYDFVRDEVRGYAANGEEVRTVPVPPPYTEVTPRQFALAAFELAAAERAGAVTEGVAEMSPADSAQLLNMMVGRLEGTPEQLGAMLPKFVDFRCGDDGTMWLRPIDLERGGMQGSATWLRIDGDDVREVRFPDRFDPYRFTDGRAWGVVRDELDVASVAWVELP